METIDLSKLKLEDQPIVCIIYGLAGCGKTHMVRDFPKPMLVYDFDNKYEPLIGMEGIELRQFLMTAPEDAKKLIPDFWRDWKQKVQGKDDYQTVVFDSITALDRALERWAVIMAGTSSNKASKAPTDRATLQEYGDMKRWYRTFFPSLLAGGNKNIVVLAHEQSKEDDGALISIRPFITGKMGDELSSIFKHTFHMEYIDGSDERWRIHYKKHKKYVSSSSSASGGVGYIEYRRGESGYEALKRLLSGK